MDKKIKTICRLANKCGFEVKHRYTGAQRDEITGIQLNNVCFAFHSESPRGVGFSFQISVPNIGYGKIFREGVSMAIYDFWQNFDVKSEAEKYLEKIGCTDSITARSICQDIASCKDMIHTLFLNI